MRRIRRLPGLPSSNICLESMTGDLDEFSMESYLGSPAEREVPGVDLHSQVLHMLAPRFKCLRVHCFGRSSLGKYLA